CFSLFSETVRVAKKMIAVVNILDVNTITIENISATRIIPKGAFQLPVSKIILPFVNTSYVIYPIKAKLIIVKILAKVLESLTFLVVKAKIIAANNGIIIGKIAKLVIVVTP